jgi:hypothetical protein
MVVRLPATTPLFDDAVARILIAIEIEQEELHYGTCKRR